jgi:hypothetical protein
MTDAGQDFNVHVAAHAARLAADRAANQPVNEPVKQPVTPAEERTGADPWGNADCWCKNPARPHYRGTGDCIVAGMTPAALRTGVSDVMAAVATEVASLRAYVASGSPFADPVVLRRLDRIALWIRGEQS